MRSSCVTWYEISMACSAIPEGDCFRRQMALMRARSTRIALPVGDPELARAVGRARRCPHQLCAVGAKDGKDVRALFVSDPRHGAPIEVRVVVLDFHRVEIVRRTA